MFSGPIVRLYVQGPWNKELVEQVHAAMGRDVKARCQGLWALMVSIKASALCGPDALDAIRHAAANEKGQSGRVATAWVLSSRVEGAATMAEIVGGVYEGINPVRIFDCEADAERWLRSVVEGAPTRVTGA